jgi:hypothetical protein
MISTDGTTTLEHDKAGVSVLIWMMKHNIPGLYYFFIGEEVGCIGSGLAQIMVILRDRNYIFDRRYRFYNNTSIICKMLFRCFW